MVRQQSEARAALHQGRKLFILESCFQRTDITWPARFEAQGAIRVRTTNDIWDAPPIRFTENDETNIDIHPRLTAEDKCLFLFKYTSGKRYDFSATNNRDVGSTVTLLPSPNFEHEIRLDYA